MDEKEKKVIWEKKDEVLQADEFLHESVPRRLRRTTWSQIWVWVGFGFMVTGLHIGGSFGGAFGLSSLTPGAAIAASIIGMGILMWITCSLGIAAQRSGFNLALLATHAYGYRGRFLPMSIMAIMTFYWFAMMTGMMGDLWGPLIGNPSGVIAFDPADFGQAWIPPIGFETLIACLIIGCIVVMNAWRGINAIELVAKITSPIMFFAGFIVLFIHLSNAGGFGAFWGMANDLAGDMPFGTAITIVVGSWIAGCIMGADLYRFNKNSRAVLICGASCFLITNPVLHAVGYVGEVTIGNFNYFTWIFQFGGVFAFLAVITWTISLWTTNNAELYCHTIYTSSVIKAITGITAKRSKVLLTMGFLAAIAGSFGLYQMLYVNFLTALGSIAPTVAGPIIADYYLCRKEKYKPKLIDKHPAFRSCGMISLIIGGALAYIFQYHTGAPFGLPSGILALLITMAIYVTLYKTVAPDRKIDDQILADATEDELVDSI